LPCKFYLAKTKAVIIFTEFAVEFASLWIFVCRDQGIKIYVWDNTKEALTMTFAMIFLALALSTLGSEGASLTLQGDDGSIIWGASGDISLTRHGTAPNGVLQVNAPFHAEALAVGTTNTEFTVDANGNVAATTLTTGGIDASRYLFLDGYLFQPTTGASQLTVSEDGTYQHPCSVNDVRAMTVPTPPGSYTFCIHGSVNSLNKAQISLYVDGVLQTDCQFDMFSVNVGEKGDHCGAIEVTGVGTHLFELKAVGKNPSATNYCFQFLLVTLSPA
jgi:hypothetical protein